MDPSTDDPVGPRARRGVFVVGIVVAVAILAAGLVASSGRDADDVSTPGSVNAGQGVSDRLDLLGFCRSAIDLESIKADGPLLAGPAPRSYELPPETGLHTTLHWVVDGRTVEMTIPPLQRIDIMGPQEELDEAYVFQEEATGLFAETGLSDTRGENYELAILPGDDESPIRSEIDPEAKQLGLEVVRSVRFREPLPEECGAAQPGLALREEGDVPDAAVAFIEETLDLPVEMKVYGGVGPMLTPDGCTISVGIPDDFEQDIAVSVTGEPGAYSITSIDFDEWAKDADGSAPELVVAIDGDELVAELEWWCDTCAAASAVLDFGTPAGTSAGPTVRASTDAPPAVFRMQLPMDDGSGALVVRVVDGDGRLRGLRSAVIDLAELRGGDQGPDCGDYLPPVFAGGPTPTDAALRFAQRSDVAWSMAEAVNGGETGDPCMVTLKAPGDDLSVTVYVTGSNGRYGVTGAHGAIPSDEGEPGVVRIEAGDRTVRVDDRYWCEGCGYRLTALEYEGLTPVALEGTDGGSSPRTLEVGAAIPDRPGLLLITTYDGERLVELSALVIPAGDFAARTFCVNSPTGCAR